MVLSLEVFHLRLSAIDKFQFGRVNGDADLLDSSDGTMQSTCLYSVNLEYVKIQMSIKLTSQKRVNREQDRRLSGPVMKNADR